MFSLSAYHIAEIRNESIHELHVSEYDERIDAGGPTSRNVAGKKHDEAEND